MHMRRFGNSKLQWLQVWMIVWPNPNSCLNLSLNTQSPPVSLIQVALNTKCCQGLSCDFEMGQPSWKNKALTSSAVIHYCWRKKIKMQGVFRQQNHQQTLADSNCVCMLIVKVEEEDFPWSYWAKHHRIARPITKNNETSVEKTMLYC